MKQAIHHSEKKVTVALICAVLTLSLSSVTACRPARADPFASLERKFSVGPSQTLNDYYKEAAGIEPGIKGIVIEAEAEQVPAIIQAIYADYVAVLPFRIEKNYGKDEKKDKVAVVKMMSQFDLVDKLRTSGKTDGVSTGEIIRALKDIHSRSKIMITGAGTDFVEFTFLETPDNWNTTARLCANIAPNIIDYGTGSLAALETELRRYNGAILWWY